MSGGRLMIAIRVSEFGAPSVLQVCSEVGIPQPGPRQVLIRVHACGVNPVETYIRAGWYPRKPTLPYTPGTDAAGVVESIGEGVTAVKAGDRVFTTATVSGGYAEYAVADDDCVYQLPEALDFAQGSAIGIPYFTAYRAVVQKAHIKPGETILVHGASGGVGVAVCQLSRALGLRVLGTAGTPEGMKLALNNGAHQAFNHREEDYTHKVMEQTSGRGVDVVVDMLSNVNLSKDLQMLASGGRVVGTAVLPQICALSQSWKVWQQIPLETISGLIRSIRRNVTFIEILVVGSRGSTEINPRDIMAKESSIVGVALTFAKPEERKECAAYLFAGMEAGWLRPVVGSQYPLEQAAQAHHDIIESPGAAGKIVLTL